MIKKCTRCSRPLDHTVPSVSLVGWMPTTNRNVPLLAWCDDCWPIVSPMVLSHAGLEWVKQ